MYCTYSPHGTYSVILDLVVQLVGPGRGGAMARLDCQNLDIIATHAVKKFYKHPKLS